MSRSPFLTFSAGHARAQAQRRRVRRRALSASGLLALVLIAAAAYLTLSGGHARSRAPKPSAAAAPPASSTDAQAPSGRSPLGLALGVPALRLGLADTRDPVHVALRPAPRAGLLFNLDSGRVLWRRQPTEQVPMASLTKMMTALLVVEHAPASAHVLVTHEAVTYRGSGVGVLPLGRRVPLEALLNGLLLPSGNDAAIALAQRVAHTVGRFVALMNQRAAGLGLGCTRYSSPSGFYDRDNFTCAADLAVLARADLAEARIARITRRRSAIEPFPIRGGRLYLYNNNPLVLLGYPGVTGLKTGFTAAAGQCLVATAERYGVRLGVVLLHSPDPGAQARQLLDAAFAGVYHQRPAPTPVIPPLPAAPQLPVRR